MIDEPVPTMPEMVPASRPTTRTKKKPNTGCLSRFADADIMVAAGSGYDVLTSPGKEPIVPIKGSCHCGNTQFEVNEAPANVTRCTCSLCAKRGALWAYYTPAQFRLTSPPENVATYLWGSRTVKHHFCANCGCGTYSESPDRSTGKPDSTIRRSASIPGCSTISTSTPCR